MGEIMKEDIKGMLIQYLKIFPKEKDRLSFLEKYLKKYNDLEMINWNNQEGHLTVGAFVYCKAKDKFLILYHKDLKMYLYPGGHIEKADKSLLEAAKRELKEETGLENEMPFLIDNQLLPFDIDTHFIPFNKRIQMKEHYHFDFRYLFLIDDIKDIFIDKEECKNYKWVSSSQLEKDKIYRNIVSKIKDILKKEEGNL